MFTRADATRAKPARSGDESGGDENTALPGEPNVEPPKRKKKKKLPGGVGKVRFGQGSGLKVWGIRLI